MKKQGVLVVYSGFSGAGKDTVLHSLVPKGHYWLSVSATTRAPRGQEVDGVDYFFVTTQEFEERIAQGQFLEWASFSGNYYGTPKDKVLEKMAEGYDVLLEIDAVGGAQIMELFPDAVSVFLTAPDLATLEQRLRSRGTETEEQIELRMAQVGREIEAMKTYEYTVINEDIEETAETVHRIIESSHERTGRKAEFIRQLEKEIAHRSAE